MMENESGVVVAVSDFMKVLPESISRWLPQRFVALGTDGFGLSETREDLRDHFEVDARYITWSALTALFAEGALDAACLEKAREALAIPTVKLDPVTL